MILAKESIPFKSRVGLLISLSLSESKLLPPLAIRSLKFSSLDLLVVSESYRCAKFFGVTLFVYVGDERPRSVDPTQLFCYSFISIPCKSCSVSSKNTLSRAVADPSDIFRVDSNFSMLYLAGGDSFSVEVES